LFTFKIAVSLGLFWQLTYDLSSIGPQLKENSTGYSKVLTALIGIFFTCFFIITNPLLDVNSVFKHLYYGKGPMDIEVWRQYTSSDNYIQSGVTVERWMLRPNIPALEALFGVLSPPDSTLKPYVDANPTCANSAFVISMILRIIAAYFFFSGMIKFYKKVRNDFNRTVQKYTGPSKETPTKKKRAASRGRK